MGGNPISSVPSFSRSVVIAFLSGVVSLSACVAVSPFPSTSKVGSASFDLLVVSLYGDHALLWLDVGTGQFSVFRSELDLVLNDPWGARRVAFGPDGSIYVMTGFDLATYSRDTAELIADITPPFDRRSWPNMTFGPDGNLYVPSGNRGVVYRYDRDTGNYLDYFVAPEPYTGTEFGPIAFGPDGFFYCVVATGDILRFNGRTKEFIDVFVERTYVPPRDLAFGPDGDLFCLFPKEVLRYNGDSGELLGKFAALDDPQVDYLWALVFAPDGRLYVTVSLKRTSGNPPGTIACFDAATGVFFETIAPEDPLLLSGPHDLAVVPKTKPPSAPTVTLTPRNPTTRDDLSVTAAGSLDPEGSSVTYSHAWFRNGVLLEQATGTTLSHEETFRSDLVECIVTPSDGVAEGIPGIASAMVRNSTPSAPLIQILPDNPTSESGMAAQIVSESVDLDDDMVIYLYEWYESTDGSHWRRRPELSGNPPPYYDQGEPAVSELFTSFVHAGEYWRVDVTPIEITEKAAIVGTGQPALDLKGALMGQPGSDRAFVLVDLDGSERVDSADLLALCANWYRTREQVNSRIRRVFFGNDDPAKTCIGSCDLLNLVRTWQRSMWD